MVPGSQGHDGEEGGGESCSEITTRVVENHSTMGVGSKLDTVTTLPSCYHFLQHKKH